MRTLKRKASSLFWLSAGTLFLLAAGCGSSQLPARVPVQGKVTWKGQPLGSGSVVFSPATSAGPEANRPATAELAADGVYRLSSFRPNDGVMPGEYRVTVVSYSSPPDPEHGKPPVSRIPARYGDPVQSGLSFTVPPGARGPLVFDIDIK
jgi:hypothetical protein